MTRNFFFLFLLDDYQKLSPKEENDLNAILSKVEDALNNVELFTEQLSSELQQLEYVSIHCPGFIYFILNFKLSINLTCVSVCVFYFGAGCRF